ncbi:MAG: hypothetical protein IKT40_07440 [Bacilli bacterium]|nr:hypothetical protein [Bacilli bacterium]
MKQVIRKAIKEANNVSDEKPIYTLLVDGNSVMKMSLVDKRLNRRGEEYGMVFQTLLQVKMQMQRKNFNHIYVFYDGDGSGRLRYEIYKDYKANRDKNYEKNDSDYDRAINEYCKKVINYSKSKNNNKNDDKEKEEENFHRQREILFKCFEELFCRQLIFDDVEGDDLIAYYCKHKKPNEKIVIVSGDRDLTQLISDDICVYVTQLKKYITPQNHIENMGYTHENVMLKKIICGDISDNIKGIKGMGEKTFFELFPEAKTKKLTLDDVLDLSEKIIAERASKKLKPLKSTENIINRVTNGCQGKDIFEINKKIIDLSEPLLTDEARDGIDSMMYAPLDPEGRDYKNLYQIIIDNDMVDLLDSNTFSSFFSSFNGLIDNEKKYFEKSS